ncbi:hypothetical protein J2751_000963 [Halorubrum alkaliphilum]|uniref:Uncharacterized protein n=1 Tax=Halorubrum alkaliphilum TaxID=261290 RepID=A0A8T4GC00_9EURY|nr:hypothetical protein [Halorubrum alkaliphilum]
MITASSWKYRSLRRHRFVIETLKHLRIGDLYDRLVLDDCRNHHSTVRIVFYSVHERGNPWDWMTTHASTIE